MDIFQEILKIMCQPNEGQYRNIPIIQLMKYSNVIQNSNILIQMIGIKIGTTH
jgi:hypothetical protein